jgi:hypothetical protein
MPFVERTAARGWALLPTRALPPPGTAPRRPGPRLGRRGRTRRVRGCRPRPRGGDADRAAGLARGVVDRGGEAGAVGLDSAHRGCDHGGVSRPRPRPQSTDAASSASSASRASPAAATRSPATIGHRPSRADPSHQPSRQRGHDGQQPEGGQDGHAGPERRAALNVLQEEGEHEERAQPAEVHRGADGVGGAERWPTEQGGRQHRIRAPAPDRHQGRQERGGRHACRGRPPR